MRFGFFDLDDTLVDAQAALRAWSADFAGEYVPEGRFDAAAADAAADVFALVSAAGNWRDFVAGARERYGVTASDEHLKAQVAAELPGKFVLEHVVRQGLAELRAAGWLLGVVTNGSTLVQQAKVDGTGLRPHVDVVIDSEAAGHRKPDRRIFEIAAAGLGVELGPHGWMVGDSLANDIAGGRAAGLRTIWITRDPAPPDEAPRATYVVDSVVAAFEVMRVCGPG